ncbi:MAG: DUF4347 domain-containing protein, partial [Pseudomonadota bacterium]
MAKRVGAAKSSLTKTRAGGKPRDTTAQSSKRLTAASMLALEPRIVFDAAAGDTAAAAADQVAEQQAAEAMQAQADAGEAANGNATADRVADVQALAAGLEPRSADQVEMVFIDSRVDNVAQLLSAIDPAAEIVMIDAQSDGVAQMAQALDGRNDIAAIHILAHGDDGQMILGNGVVDATSIEGAHAESFRQIGAALSENGDILIYGCDFGQGVAGARAAELLADLTGADIAASDDVTGHADLGGDWDLERTIGHVEAEYIRAESWQSTLAVGANVTLTGVPDGAIRGTDFTFSVNVDNTGDPNEVAEFPYVNVWMPATADAPSSASFGGGDVLSETPIVYDASGNSTATHPITGDALPQGSGFENATLYVYRLPLLEVTGADVPPALQITTALSDTLALGDTTQFRASGGFITGNHQAGLTSANTEATPATILKTVQGEDSSSENVSGPSHPLTYTINVDLEGGLAFDDLVVNDVMADALAFVDGTLAINGVNIPALDPTSDLPHTVTVGSYDITITDLPLAGQANPTSDNNFTFTIADGHNGLAAPVDLAITYQAFIADRDSSGNLVVPTPGNPVDILNESVITGDVPAETFTFDVGTDASFGTDDQDGSDATIAGKSVALQKSVTLIDQDTDNDSINEIDGIPAPDDLLQWQIKFQVSDFFELDNIVIDDVFSDGQEFVDTFAPTWSIQENGATSNGAFSTTGMTLVTGTGGLRTWTAPNFTVTENADGTTSVQFDFTDETGEVITGDLFASGDTTITDESEVRIVFQTRILEAYRTTQVSPDTNLSVDLGDRMSNRATVTGDVTHRASTGTSTEVSDDGSAGIRVGDVDITKVVFAVNGSTTHGDQFEAGDLVTYRVTLNMPIADAEQFRLRDYGDFSHFDFSSLSVIANPTDAGNLNNTIPGENEIKFGTNHNLHVNVDTSVYTQADVPQVVHDPVAEFFELDFGDFDRTDHQATTVDVFYTVRALDFGVADGSDVENQAWVLSRTSQAQTLQEFSSVTATRLSPELQLRKAVVSTSNTDSHPSFSSSLGNGVTWESPGEAATAAPFTGAVDRFNETNANLDHVSDGDLVKFAIVVENTGADDAWDVTISDTFATDLEVPGGGAPSGTTTAADLNLKVYDGDSNEITGATIVITATGFAVTLPDNAGVVGDTTDGTA